ncbi:MAG: DNA recombination protein RmuC [Terriglobales bacterium]
MTAAFFFLLGCLLGAAFAWALARRDRAQLALQLEAALPRMAESALRGQSEQLQHSNELQWKLLGQDTVHQVQASQAGLEAGLAQMQATLAGYQERITAFEKERAGAQAVISKQLETVVGVGTTMAQEARTLREALATSSGVRGAWGENVLQNILNACGLNQQIDYDLQVILPGGLRPDAVIYLPSGRTLALDAKASLTAFLDGLEAASDERRLACFAEFAKVLRSRAKDLAAKDYPGALERSLPVVFMFVPSEGAFRAALDADAKLFAFAQSLKPPVALASPTTLFPMLVLVAQGWQQHKAAQQMHELLDEVGELGKRLATFTDHLVKLGAGLDKAVEAYAAARASFRSRLSPQLDKLQELNAGWKALPELKAVERADAAASAAPTE